MSLAKRLKELRKVKKISRGLSHSHTPIAIICHLLDKLCIEYIIAVRCRGCSEMMVERCYSSDPADWVAVTDFLIAFILRLLEKQKKPRGFPRALP